MKKIRLTDYAMILAGAVARVLPHAPNFTPTGALAFYSGSKMSLKAALSISLGILFLSDLVLGWHSTMFFVYAGFALTALLGHALKDTGTAGKISGLAASSLLFFVTTNFGVWLTSGMYPHSLAGLSACYVAALPFLSNELLSTMLYGGAFFGASKMIEHALKARGVTAPNAA